MSTRTPRTQKKLVANTLSPSTSKPGLSLLMPETEVPTAESAEAASAMYTVNPVDDSYVEQLVRAKEIGTRIRKLRLKRSMGLVELGQRTGMSASFLSQLETGRVVPTIRNLARIALFFGKELAYFFEEKNQNCFRKSRSADRVRLSIGDKQFPYLIAESMNALIPNRSLVPCIAEFFPNQLNASFEPRVFRGQEFVYVMHGSITLSLDNGRDSERQILETEDVVWIDGNTRRRYSCNENKPAKAMIITCPQ